MLLVYLNNDIDINLNNEEVIIHNINELNLAGIYKNTDLSILHVNIRRIRKKVKKLKTM